MIHPIISHQRAFYLYLSAWTIFAVAQAAFLYLYAGLSLYASVIDATIYNSVMVLLGFSLWYPVEYNQKKETFIKILLHSFITGIALIAIWAGISHIISGAILANNEVYLVFTKRIFSQRIMVGSFLILILMSLYNIFIFYRDLEDQKIREKTLKNQIKEAELKALKAQLNPHFLFNSLNSIGSLTISDPDGARIMINQLSDFLRYSLQKNNDQYISLKEELQNIDRYLQIEKVRFSDRLICETETDPDSLNLKLPAMILQPLYENAIKHGLYESIEPVTIRTYCQVNKGDLEISIINNFDPQSVSTRGEGVGIENTANILKNIYNHPQLLLTRRENSHFEVSLTIPQI